MRLAAALLLLAACGPQTFVPVPAEPETGDPGCLALRKADCAHAVDRCKVETLEECYAHYPPGCERALNLGNVHCTREEDSAGNLTCSKRDPAGFGCTVRPWNDCWWKCGECSTERTNVPVCR